MPPVSSLVANLAFLLLVPGAVVLAYLGYARGLYSYWLLPLVFGVLVATAVTALFLALPRLRRHE